MQKITFIDASILQCIDCETVITAIVEVSEVVSFLKDKLMGLCSQETHVMLFDEDICGNLP